MVDDQEMQDLLQAAQQQYFPQQTTGGVLPVQSEMAAKPIAPEPVPDLNAPLPTLSKDKIAEALTTSGKPSEQEQTQAGLHQSIGNAMANFHSGIQNAIGILKPGAANYAQAEMAKQRGDQLAAQTLAQAPERRKEAVQNVTLQGMLEERQTKQRQMLEALKQQKDMQDPMSSLSLQAQQSAMGRINALQSASSNPRLIYQMEQIKKSIPFMSASRLQSMEKDSTFEKLVGMESNERAAGAKNAVQAEQNANTARHQAAEEALGWAKLDEDKNKPIKAQMNEDLKIEEDLIALNNTKSQLMKHIHNLANGTTDNNKVHALANKAAKAGSAWGLPATPDPKLQDLLTVMPLAQGTVEKAVTGSSRYTPQRWTQFNVEEGEGNQNSVNKLKGGAGYVSELYDEKLTRMHVDKDGNPTSTSAFAKSLAPGAIQKAAERLRARDALRAEGFEPSEDPTKDLAALNWVKSHPNDPMAPQVMKKLRSR